MYAARSALFVALAICLLAADDKVRTWRFSKQDEGKAPSGWKIAKTGMGEGSSWIVTADATAPSKSGYVVSQVAQGPNTLFNLCVEGSPSLSYGDLELSVAFKANKGILDQGGGLVWRYQDADNYYIARMNPLENNFRLYTVLAGKRTQLVTVEDLKIKSDEWHNLSIKQVGKKITCSLDGKLLIEAENDAITRPGAIGLWTKADAQTSFDDLRAESK
jgi:3-keto-disaccharide hydrolase